MNGTSEDDQPCVKSLQLFAGQLWYGRPAIMRLRWRRRAPRYGDGLLAVLFPYFEIGDDGSGCGCHLLVVSLYQAYNDYRARLRGALAQEALNNVRPR